MSANLRLRPSLSRRRATRWCRCLATMPRVNLLARANLTLMLTLTTTVEECLRGRLHDIGATPVTTAYVIGVLASKGLNDDLAMLGSVTLTFHRAGLDFNANRTLADSVLASEVAFKGWLVEPDLCVDLARISYSRCWRLLRGTWTCYDELADRLPSVIRNANAAWQRGT